MRAQTVAYSGGSNGPSVWYNMATILLILMLAGIGGAYLIDGLHRTERIAEEHPTTLLRTLGGQSLEIPRTWFRYDEQDQDGFAKQVDLRLNLPLGAEGAATPIDVTLMARSRVRPSASLLDGVYLHQFAPEQIQGVPGLVGKPMRAGDGYDGEVVWYDPVSPNPFVAKCSPAIAGDTRETCLRMVYLGPGMAAVYSFDKQVLPNWRNFDAVLEARLSQIGAL